MAKSCHSSPELFEGIIHSLLQLFLGFLNHLHLSEQLLLHRIPHHIDVTAALTERQALNGNIQTQVLCLNGIFCCFLYLEEAINQVWGDLLGMGERKEGEPTHTVIKRDSHCLSLQF